MPSRSCTRRPIRPPPMARTGNCNTPRPVARSARCSTLPPWSHARRIGLGQVGLIARPAFQRLQRRSFVDVEHGIELVGQTGAKIMARALGLRTIDDADGALQPRL